MKGKVGITDRTLGFGRGRSLHCYGEVSDTFLGLGRGKPFTSTFLWRGFQVLSWVWETFHIHISMARVSGTILGLGNISHPHFYGEVVRYYLGFGKHFTSTFLWRWCQVPAPSVLMAVDRDFGRKQCPER